jgi:hypothetical protein
VAVVEKAIKDGGSDDTIAEDLAPFGEPLVAGKDDAATLVASGDQREEGGSAEAVVGPDAELVDDEDLRRKVDAHAPIQSVLGLSAAQVFDQVVGADKVNALPVIYGAHAEGDGEMRLADTRWA